MVGVAKALEAFGRRLQQGGVVEWVVAIENRLLCDIFRALERRRGLYRLDVPAIAPVQSLYNHCRAALLALKAIAGDVWSGDERFVEQLTIDGGLVLPAVKGDIAMPL